jgi:hypothetical protein
MNRLSLIDMDIGLFISYEVTAEALTTKLFRFIILNRKPLKCIMDFRVAESEDITHLNRVNWHAPRTLTPMYTLKTAKNSPRIFMRLDQGSHIEMHSKIKGVTDE